MTPRRVAAVDCGTNSIRLLLADLDTERMVATDIARQMKIVRLGEGVDRTGRLADAAIDRTIDALREYADLIRETRPEAVRMVATSASRDAENAAEFTRRVKEVLGVEPEVVSGDEEARLSFLGSTRSLEGQAGGPFLVTDIGGGSTEFCIARGDDPPQCSPGGHPPDPRTPVRGRSETDRIDRAGRSPLVHISVDIGCVRITERRLHSDPPTEAEIAEAVADIDAALSSAAEVVPATEARTLVGLAGSVTTVAGIALGLDHYDSTRIHHSRVSAECVHEIAARLLSQTHAERAAIGVMHPGRVDVIAGGALILDRIMTRFAFDEVLVSEHDILDGIAWNLLR